MKKQFTLQWIYRSFMTLFLFGFLSTANAQVDAGVATIVSPSTPACSGQQSVRVVIHNYGAAGLTSVTVNWSVNNMPQTPYSYSGLLFTGGNDTVNIGSYGFMYGMNMVSAFTSNPNNQGDADVSNDSASTMFSTKMNGTYTIGGTTPDFGNLILAVSALVSNGICGPVVFNMRAGSDTLQSIINEVPGADSVNTITFQAENGDSSSVVLTFPSAPALTATNYLIQLDGADYFIFNKLTLQRTGIEPYARVLEITNNATHNRISNCRLISSTNPTNNSLAALIYSSGTNATNDSSTTIINNRFINGSIGVYMNGINTIELELDIVIANNIFQNQYSKGIQISNLGATRITKNEMTTNSMNIAYAGIYMDRSQRNHIITKNKMTSIPGTGIYAVDCTGLAGIHGIIANNFILCTDSAGVSMINGDYQDLVHNTVVMRGTNPTYSALFMRGSGSGKNVRNNILNNTGGGYAYVVSDSAVFGIAISNNNNLFVTGTNVGEYNGTITASLSNWKAASGKDSNSVQVNPNFVTPIDLHATSIAMEDLGRKLPNVNDDIDDEVRNANAPDIGADEYSAAQRNVGVQAILSPIDSTCGDSAAIVTVVVSNTGALQENNFAVTTTLSGIASAVLTYTITTPLQPGMSDTITYSTTVNLAATGTLNIESHTSLGVDDVHANDTLIASYHISLPPVAPMATDVSRCGPGSVTLTASPTDSLIWHTAAIGGIYLASSNTYTTPNLSGTTTYYVSNYRFCEGARAAVQAIIDPLPIVALGNDTSILDGNSITFDAGAGFNSYLWSTGATTQTITASTTGCYTVTVTNTFGCSNSDEICLTVIVPFDAGVTSIASPLNNDCANASTPVQIVVKNLGSNVASSIPVRIVITGSATITFNQTVAGPLNPGDSAIVTMGTLNSSAGGTYNMLAYTSYTSDQNTSNDTTNRTINIYVAPGMPAGIGTARCGSGPVILNASGSNTTNWYDASTGGNLLFVGDSYSIPNLATTTTFYAQSGNVCNTQPRAAVLATINQLPTVFLGNDTSIVGSIVLDAGAGFTQYLWNTNASTQTITADSSGTYIVAVMDGNGCINSDSINLTISIGISESQFAAGIRVYPNPTNDKLNVISGTADETLIKIVDLQGQILLTDNIRGVAKAIHTYDVSKFAKGIYFLQFTSKDQSSTSKVIIQ